MDLQWKNGVIKNIEINKFILEEYRKSIKLSLLKLSNEYQEKWTF